MLYNLKIKTSDNESISINDVDFIGLGNVSCERPSIRQELCVRCNHGMFSFPLSKIKSIEFTIKNDDRVIMVVSNEQKRKGEKQKCQMKN